MELSGSTAVFRAKPPAEQHQPMSAGPRLAPAHGPFHCPPPRSLASSQQRTVGSLAMIDGIQAVHCDPAKAHTQANTLNQNCSGVHKLGSKPVRSGGKLFQYQMKLSFMSFIIFYNYYLQRWG